MSRRLNTALAAALALPALAPALAPAVLTGIGGPLGSAGAAVAATTGSLSVSPSRYVPGEAVRFTGNLGVGGVQSIHLQQNMNRPGDTWVDVPSSTFSTDSGGNFDFLFRAPSMINISYRVVGGGQTTGAYKFDATPQELTLTPPGGDPNYPFYRERAGASYTVVVDTTPAVGGAWGTPPPIQGRSVVLQQRVSPTGWQNVATGTSDANGNVSFTVTAPASGTQVLRAKERSWTVGGNSIGWYASFPAYFVVSGAASVTEPRQTAYQEPSSAPSSRATASGRFRWGPARYDYAWEAGQSLNSPPSKGDVRSGRWQAVSDGTGRVTPFNGGMVLQSKFKRVGPGDRGSVMATMSGAAQTYGRWEFRLQGRLWETGATPYQFRLELVPADAPATTCSPQSIVLGEFTMGSPGMDFGVRSAQAGTAWTGHLPNVLLGSQPFNLAVEVAPDHITWFRDSDPIGTVTDPAAQLGTDLVPRLSLVGPADTEMNGTQINSDWQRSWTLHAGQQVTDGAPLTQGAYSGC